MAITNTGARFNATAIQNGLYEFYLPGFRMNMKDPEKHYFMNAIEGNGYISISGKYAVYGLQSSVMGGAGAISDTGDYKDPDTSDKDRQLVYMKNLQANASIDLKTIAAGKKGDGAFDDALANEMSTMLISATKDKARQMFTTETGTIDTVKTTVTTQDFTASGGIGLVMNSVNRFEKGYRVDIYDGVTLKADEMRIVDIDRSAVKIYLESTSYTTETVNALTVTAGFLVINSGAKGYEITGLEAALYGSSGNDDTYHGIDRTTNKWYVAEKYAHDASALDEAILREAKDGVDINGYGVCDLMVARHEVVRGYETELTTLKRYSETGTKTLAGGYKALLHDDQPFVKDRDSSVGYVYGINKSTFEKPTYEEWTFDDFDGNIFKFTGGPRYTFRMIEFCNITTDNPRSNFVITNVLDA